jgi:protein SCO1
MMACRALALIALVVSGSAAGAPAPSALAESGKLRSGAFDPPRPAPDFALLPAAGGAEFRLSDHLGKVVVLTFGYTSCPDVCPTVLAELAQVRERLGGAAKRVQIVYVSVDPDRDNPARLRGFTEQFDRSFVGLTGPMDQLAPVWKAYGVSVVRRDLPGSKPPTYLIHHSASVFLVDPAGRLRVMAPFGTPSDDVLHDIRILLTEAESGAGAPAASIVLEKPWVRRAVAMPDAKPGAPATAGGYVTVLNRGKTPDALIAATADVAERVEVHETRSMSGMVMMEKVAKVELAPGSRVELKPGSYHLMLIGLKRTLAPGQTVTLTLEFERAGRITTRAEVR